MDNVWPNKALTTLASCLWSSLSHCARFSARKGWLKGTQLNARVISVGNIQAGGAGKTPLVAQIANEAIQNGLKTCILIRGYKSRWESEGGLILPDSPAADASLCGDEAALLHDLSPKAYIGVGADRLKQYDALHSQGVTVDLVILDDGFQHWRIKKDVEVVALTSAKPSQILFRDFPQSVANANLLVWTKGEVRPAMGNCPMAVVDFQLTEAGTQDPYWLVTGVASGISVKEMATRFGYRVARHLQYSDHAGYSQSSVHKILEQASKNGARVLLTGKDWVKWRTLGISPDDVTVIEPKLEVKEGKENWTRILWGK